MQKERETLFLNALEQNKEKLFRVCSLYSSGTEDAKDLFQEVMIHIWNSMGAFKGNSAVGTWMFRIALNVCLRIKSKHTKHHSKLVRLDSIIISNVKSMDNHNGQNEKLKALRKCVENLNEGDRALVALYLEGMAYKEISTILGLSENHIAVKIKRLKLKLLNCINKLL